VGRERAVTVPLGQTVGGHEALGFCRP
jgi:hypothetical protein